MRYKQKERDKKRRAKCASCACVLAALFYSGFLLAKTFLACLDSGAKIKKSRTPSACQGGSDIGLDYIINIYIYIYYSTITTD